MLTFPKTSNVTKLSLSAHPSKGPQFFAFQPESLDGPRFDRHGFRNSKKKKRSLDPKGAKKNAALQIGSEDIELVTHRHLHGSFDWFSQRMLFFTLHTFAIDKPHGRMQG